MGKIHTRILHIYHRQELIVGIDQGPPPAVLVSFSKDNLPPFSSS